VIRRRNMKNLLGQLAFAVFIVYGTAGYAADFPSGSSPTIIEGTVLRVHSSSFLLKDQSGREIHVYFDQDTKRPDDIRRGEYIVARFDGNPSNSATSITRGSAGSTQAPSISVPGATSSPQAAPTRAPQAFEGEVLRFAGDSYIVRDITGREVRLDIGRNTKIDSGVTMGNQVLVQTSSTPSNDVPYARQMYLIEGPKAIQGELVRIERNIYIVKDPAGIERSLYVDTDTLGDRNLKPGDKVFILISQLPVVQPDSVIKR
jgi:hypothetical protein